MLVCHVNLNERKAQEICGCHVLSSEERATAIDAVIRYNLQELVELGKVWDGWSEEERRILGLPPAERVPDVVEEPAPPRATMPTYAPPMEPFA